MSEFCGASGKVLARRGLVSPSDSVLHTTGFCIGGMTGLSCRRLRLAAMRPRFKRSGSCSKMF